MEKSQSDSHFLHLQSLSSQNLQECPLRLGDFQVFGQLQRGVAGDFQQLPRRGQVGFGLPGLRFHPQRRQGAMRAGLEFGKHMNM